MKARNQSVLHYSTLYNMLSSYHTCPLTICSNRSVQKALSGQHFGGLFDSAYHRIMMAWSNYFFLLDESLDRMLLNEVQKCGELLQQSCNVCCLNSSAKAPLPLLKWMESFYIFGLSKVRPKRRCEEKLGVCKLPQKEVAYPQFTAGADKQIWTGEISCTICFQFLLNYRFSDITWLKKAVLHLASNLLACLHNVIPSTVTNSYK